MASNLKETTLRIPLVLLTALVLLNSACAIVSYSPTEPVKTLPLKSMTN